MEVVRALEKNRNMENRGNDRGGAAIGKYTMVRSLGKGGEGSVYLARDEHLQRYVAVKCVRETGMDTDNPDEQEKENSICQDRQGSWENSDDREGEREKIMREAGYLQRLEHPMLPVVYDLFADDEGVWYLVMEYIQGMTLRDYIERNGFVQEEQARIWAGQLADVLGYLHTRKPPVIYSDLKPDNIMVCPDRRLRLVDFGAALTRSFGAGRNRKMAATPGYGAPEQWGSVRERQEGHRCAEAAFYADERSDIYAFGKVLYYMVTGADPARPPYAALPVYEYQPLLGDGLEAVIRKCIRQEPAGRYQTVEEMQGDLCRKAAGRRRAHRKSFIRAIEKKVWLTEGEIAEYTFPGTM